MNNDIPFKEIRIYLVSGGTPAVKSGICAVIVGFQKLGGEVAVCRFGS